MVLVLFHDSRLFKLFKFILRKANLVCSLPYNIMDIKVVEARYVGRTVAEVSSRLYTLAL